LNKTRTDRAAPWERLQPELAARLRPVLPGLVDEVIAEVQSAVPAYETGVDRNVRAGVRQALEGFLELVEGGDEAQVPARDVYFAFGRGEARSGRTLDALLSAYRAGAQVAWRGLARAGGEAGIEPHAMYALAEAIFAYIDEISAASAEGYAFEQSLAARERHEHRLRLLEALLQEPQPPLRELEQASAAAGWKLPEWLAALVFDAPQPDRTGARLPETALVAGLEGLGWALVPDPDAPGRRAELMAALHDARAALGPAGPLTHAPESARRARMALDIVARRPGRLVAADEHLFDLILHRDAALARELAERRLAPLAQLPPRTRERLLETLEAWLDEQGEVRPAAERLHVHVQTVRYRLGQLRDVLGDALDDAQGRLELALALRAESGPAQD
jgi:PucR C-terminal helix-turn-helix domain